jgi:hypothetical protein
MKKFLIFLTISLFAICCRSTNIKDENQLITFNLKELPEITTLKLSDLGFVDIEYIPLETNEYSMIPRINDIKIGNGFFLIQHFNTILKFRTDGSFDTKIGTEGRGPNEFLVAHDVDIDNKDQSIYIVSGWQKKFYVYSESGAFIKTFRAPIFAAISFRFTEDGILIYNKNSSANVENSYNLIDTAGKIIKNLPNKYPWSLKQKSTVIFDENLFYRYNNKLYKKEVYSDTVYVFEHSNFRPHLVIEHGEKLLTPKARSDYEPNILFEKYISQKNLFEFGDYFYYEFMYDFKRGRNNIVKGFIGSKKDDTQFLINSEKGLFNDLDGGPNILPLTIKDENTIIGWVDALQLKSHVASEAFKNSNPKYPEKKKELEKLANSLKETDNPVLMLVRLKK